MEDDCGYDPTDPFWTEYAKQTDKERPEMMRPVYQPEPKTPGLTRASLTPREQEVKELMLQGWTNSQIGQQLGGVVERERGFATTARGTRDAGIARRAGRAQRAEPHGQGGAVGKRRNFANRRRTFRRDAFRRDDRIHAAVVHRDAQSEGPRHDAVQSAGRDHRRDVVRADQRPGLNEAQ